MKKTQWVVVIEEPHLPDNELPIYVWATDEQSAINDLKSEWPWPMKVIRTYKVPYKPNFIQRLFNRLFN